MNDEKLMHCNEIHDPDNYAEDRGHVCDKNHPKDCITEILCNLAKQSKCETQLICEATAKLSYQIRCSKNFQELNTFLNMANSLLSTSANNTKALAEVITAYSKIYSNNFCCCNCYSKSE